MKIEWGKLSAGERDKVIAEALGWFGFTAYGPHGHNAGFPLGATYLHPVPHYTSDLNAAHSLLRHDWQVDWTDGTVMCDAAIYGAGRLGLLSTAKCLWADYPSRQVARCAVVCIAVLRALGHEVVT